ncbi:MAG: Gfo/Idh/MocA family oxidoreductase [Gammaproteobacteria bacterium]|nr:Gfo/Idh/MocA family oxidoreductase [Gammaproteobacteria bacterium]
MLKLIHLGTGGRGRHWLDFVAARPDVETVACVDVDQAALDAVRQKTGCKTFLSLEEALAETAADGVLVASPSHMHGAHARQILQAGFAVMVEKPLAGSLREAVDVVHAAREANRPLMVAENYRFFRAERTLRKFLDGNHLGRIQSVVCIDRRDQPSRAQGAWVTKMAQPFLTEIAVHHFDSFRYLFNSQPEAVWARTFNPQGSDYEQNAAAETLLDLQGGIHIQYSGSFVGSRYEYSLSIEGEHGDVRTDRSKVWWRPRGRKSFSEVAPVQMPEGESLRYPDAGMLSMLAQFRQALTTGRAPETSGADNLWTLAMFEAAVQSAQSGRYVSIDEIFTPELRARAGIAEES